MAVSIKRLTRIALNSADPEKLARFYVGALSFSLLTGASSQALALMLGSTRLDLAQATGRPYPPDVPGWSPLFQHCAIVTNDMQQALTRLQEHEDWTAISTEGPERLPQSSGGVVAFKFRDPEGHPLELLAFPNGSTKDEAANLFQRIDHSAISVAETERSTAFYLGLGLKVGAQSLNVGPEQERLDAVPAAEVEVTALVLPSGTKPHVELLCYRDSFDRDIPPAEPGDIAATRLVFAAETRDAQRMMCERHFDRLIVQDGPKLMLRDLDGHIVEIEGAEEANPSAR
jgi:catechol 2,3-dioxygenase-like lactoylglutathione lyase family enzyme